MKIKWEGNHAKVGPFKLNVSNVRGFISWQVSTPGTVWDGSFECESEDEAKAEAQAWVERQLINFLTDVGVESQTVIDLIYGTARCKPCYGTGRWGDNDSEVHEPCKGTGRVRKGVASA